MQQDHYLPKAENVPSRRHARLLVVDDDPDVRSTLRRFLEADGYEVDQAGDIDDAMGAVASRHPDLMILDVILDGESGLELLSRLRRANGLPVILLSGRHDETDKVVGLRLGADDYVAKPFSPAELSARVLSVLRRADKAPQAGGPVLDFGDLTVDLRSREVRLRGTLVATTAKEFDLLAFLARSPRQVFSRDQLLTNVWDSRSYYQDESTVTEHVRRIRQKIEADPHRPRWLHTIHGVGYRFDP